MGDKRIKVWVQRFRDRRSLVLQWHDPVTGRRKSKSAGTANAVEARARRGDLEADLNRGQHRQASRMTWKNCRELFEREYVAGLRENTRGGYGATLDLFEELCQPSRLVAITERTISAFVVKMRERPTRGRPGMQASTIKVRLQFLHTVLAWAVGQKLLPAVPAFPSVKVPRKRPQPVPVESFERLLASAEDAQMKAYLLCGWLAGLRLSEAFKLEWEATDQAPWVDFARNRIVLPAEMVKAVEDQWVPLDPTLRAALDALPRRGRKVFHFTAPDGHPVSAGALSDRVALRAKRAGVRLTFHSLRKGFGCRHAGRVPAQVLQRLMRHANIATSMAFYANIDLAVEEAILGPRGSDPRNNEAEANDPGAPPDVLTLVPTNELGRLKVAN